MKYQAFSHNDMQDLENIISKQGRCYQRLFIVVEGVYSMDGDIAPLAQIVDIAKRWNCITMGG